MRKLTFSRDVIKIFLFGTVRVWKGNDYGSLTDILFDWQENQHYHHLRHLVQELSGGYNYVGTNTENKHSDSALFNSKSLHTKESSNIHQMIKFILIFGLHISSSKSRLLTGWMSVWMILFEMRIQALSWVLLCIPEP